MMVEGEGVRLMVGDGGRQDMGRQWEKEREREGKKGGFMRHRDT